MSEVDLGAAALVVLGLVSLLCGLAMRWVFRKCSDPVSIARTRGRMIAHLLEFRLFGDEPWLVLRAQRDVAMESFRLLRLLIGPAIVMTLPLVLLFVQLDALFGRPPLVPGQPAVVTARWTGEGEPPRLEASRGISVETLPVRAAGAQQVSWRFRPLQAGRGELRLRSGERTWTKSVTAGSGLNYVSARRVGLGAEFPLNATEPPLPNDGVEWIEINYGTAVVCGFHWLAWFLLFSTAAFFAAGQ